MRSRAKTFRVRLNWYAFLEENVGMKKRTSTYLLRLPLSLKAATAYFGDTEANRRSPMIA